MKKRDVLLLTIDLGTTFIKASVYDKDSNMIARTSVKVVSECSAPGVFTQRGEDIFNSVLNCMKAISDQLGSMANKVEAISFTGQMSGFMGVDKNWNDITTWSCSMDTRYIPYAEILLSELGDQFLRISGTNSPQMAPKFKWFKTEFQGEANKIEKYLMISGYVIGRLGDLSIDDAVIDKTYTQWTGLVDLKKAEWSNELCDAVGMDKRHLPRIIGSNVICGHLSARMAAITGFMQGIPLVSGAGDKVAGCLGSNVVNDGDMILEASSYGAITCCIDGFSPDFDTKRYDIVPSAIDGQYLALNYIIGSGMTLDWFVNLFGENMSASKNEDFDELERKVNQVAMGCNGLMAIGLLGGSAQPLDGSLKGMWMGFDWSHKKEHFYRALLESYCYDFALTIRSIKRVNPGLSIDKVKIIGGGANSAVWTQMSADIIGKTYQRLNREDVAMWGAAILAGNAIGLFPDIKKTASENVGIKTEYLPNMTNHWNYLKYIDNYKKFVSELQPYYRILKE